MSLTELVSYMISHTSDKLCEQNIWIAFQKNIRIFIFNNKNYTFQL